MQKIKPHERTMPVVFLRAISCVKGRISDIRNTFGHVKDRAGANVTQSS
jgi:hypothetical protein